MSDVIWNALIAAGLACVLAVVNAAIVIATLWIQRRTAAEVKKEEREEAAKEKALAKEEADREKAEVKAEVERARGEVKAETDRGRAEVKAEVAKVAVKVEAVKAVAVTAVAEVKDVKAVLANGPAAKLDTLIATTGLLHTLANSAEMEMEKEKRHAAVLNRLAKLTKDPADEAEAEAAEKLYREHKAAQDKIDAKGCP